MLRIALIDLLFFALPFLIYAAYMIAVKGVAPANVLRSAPVMWLLAAGFGLMLIVLVTLVQFSGGERDGTYHPSVIEDGVIKPGGID
jgi:hypothetical protein